MTLRHMRIFSAVYRCGSITKAAEALYLTQPSVSVAIQELEAHYGVRLFERINRDGQTILMVTHSVKAASHAKRVLFIKDGEVFHQLYRGEMSREAMYGKIADTLTVLQSGVEGHE